METVRGTNRPSRYGRVPVYKQAAGGVSCVFEPEGHEERIEALAVRHAAELARLKQTCNVTTGAVRPKLRTLLRFLSRQRRPLPVPDVLARVPICWETLRTLLREFRGYFEHAGGRALAGQTLAVTPAGLEELARLDS